MTIELEQPRQERRESLGGLCSFFPRQLEALDAVLSHRYTLYGGAAGGGKSRFLRWVAVILLQRWRKRGHRNVRIGLFSVDYPTLHDRQLSKIREEFPEWLGEFHEQSREFRLRGDMGVVCFRNLDDPAKYKSAEFAAILVDELTENEEGVFRFLAGSRLRWPGIDDVKFVGATNPGSIGHEWCKRFWISRDFPPEMAPQADEFAYVRSTALDNPHNSAAYHRQLDSLPPALRGALRDGSWDIFAGQVFAEFRREIHVVEPFEIPSWWFRFGANDPGYADPGVWYRLAVDQSGCVYVYAEQTFEQVPYLDQAKAVRQAMTTFGADDVKREKPILEAIGYWVTGMDAFTAEKGTRDGKSFVDYYGQGGLFGFRRPVHGAGARANMAGTVHEYLKPIPHPTDPDKRTARLRIFSSCRRLIETLPSLPADELHPEQVDECAIDHWYQALGYGLQSLHAKDSTKPTPTKLPEGTIGRLLNWDDADDQGRSSIWRRKSP